MAYAVTGTLENERKRITVSGRRHLVYTITETSASATSEFELTKIPFHMMTLVKYQSTVTAGDGTTIRPGLGKVTSWSVDTQNDIALNTSREAHIDDESTIIIRNDTNSIFIMSNINTGSNSTITSQIIFAEGT